MGPVEDLLARLELLLDGHVSHLPRVTLPRGRS
jgi:hypothetical protein